MDGAELVALGKTVAGVVAPILLAALTVTLLRRRWPAPADPGRRAGRIAGITLAAIAAGLLWQLLLTVGITVAVLALLLRRARRPARRPGRPAGSYYQHGSPSGGVSGRSPGGGRSPADDYWDQRARHDQEQRYAEQYEADMYRWGHRHHQPPRY